MISTDESNCDFTPQRKDRRRPSVTRVIEVNAPTPNWLSNDPNETITSGFKEVTWTQYMQDQLAASSSQVYPCKGFHLTISKGDFLKELQQGFGLAHVADDTAICRASVNRKGTTVLSLNFYTLTLISEVLQLDSEELETACSQIRVPNTCNGIITAGLLYDLLYSAGYLFSENTSALTHRKERPSGTNNAQSKCAEHPKMNSSIMEMFKKYSIL